MTRAVAVLVVLALSSCAAELERQRVRSPALFTRVRSLQAGLTPETVQLIDQHCPEGMPATAPAAASSFGPFDYVARGGYALQHSARLKIPLWVCERVDAAQLTGPLPRPKNEPFKPEPTIAKNRRAELEDYKKSGYDRGHQAPSADQTVDQTLQNETYYLSNMAPQLPELNREVWRLLEEQIRDWAVARGSAWFITGPLFYDPAEEDPATADGLVEHENIGPGAVAVATHFYKIVVAGTGAQRRAIAFVFEHREYEKPYRFDQQIQSIDWIEERTGLNFMPNLNPADELALEAAPSPLWQ